MKKAGLLMIMLLVCGSLFAEFRTWRDVDGTFFEGEFDKEFLGEILVKDRKNRTHYIPIDKLSKQDLAYVQYNVPVEIKINFSKKTRQRPEMEWTINNDRTILYTCTVEVKKDSNLPSKAKYKAELFVFGEEVDGDNYILMHWEPSVFVFPDGEDSSYEFTVKDIPFRTYPTWGEAPYRIRGQRYMGYIVAVSDSEGNIFKYDSDLPRLPWLDDGFPAAIEKLREIYKNGRGSTHSRHFNDSFRKTQTPRIKWHRRTNYF